MSFADDATWSRLRQIREEREARERLARIAAEPDDFDPSIESSFRQYRRELARQGLEVRLSK